MKELVAGRTLLQSDVLFKIKYKEINAKIKCVSAKTESQQLIFYHETKSHNLQF
jgi:hypothetical protein